jgi:hypothetical protein
MAARIAGGDAFESGLVKSHAAVLLFDAYMNGQLGGLLAAGYRPPIAEGFARFLGAEGVAAALQEADKVMREGASDPYDSHPSLKERLDALRGATHWGWQLRTKELSGSTPCSHSLGRTHGRPVALRLDDRGRARGPRHGHARRRGHHAFRGARSIVAGRTASGGVGAYVP